MRGTSRGSAVRGKAELNIRFSILGRADKGTATGYSRDEVIDGDFTTGDSKDSEGVRFPADDAIVLISVKDGAAYLPIDPANVEIVGEARDSAFTEAKRRHDCVPEAGIADVSRGGKFVSDPPGLPASDSFDSFCLVFKPSARDRYVSALISSPYLCALGDWFGGDGSSMFAIGSLRFAEFFKLVFESPE